MNKKGFTLVELLSILFLIAIIATISFRLVTTRIKSSKEKAYNILVSDLERAGERYMLEHKEVDKSINDDGNNILTDIETGNNYSIKTRKKEKIMYFDNKYYKRGKKLKKILRKKKTALVGKARKYYIDED